MNVLLLEPQLNIRTILRGVFTGLDDINFHAPNNSFEAVKFLLTSKVDLLICSEQAKPIIGRDLVELIRQVSGTAVRRTPVMIITSTNNINDIKDFLAIGVDEILCIPFSYDAALARIHRVSKKRAQFLEFNCYVGPDRRRNHLFGYDPEQRNIDDQPEQKKFSQNLNMLVKNYLDDLERTKFEEGDPETGKEASVTMDNKNKLFTSEKRKVKNSLGLPKKLTELRPGMLLAENVVSTSGLRILGSDTPLTEASITRIADMVNVGRLNDKFRIQT